MRIRKMPSSGQGTIMTKEISEGIKTLLGKHVRILLKTPVKLEAKADKTENRILVLCPCRFFCLKVPPRIDFHFHYLEIQAIESKRPNQLVVVANDKTYSFLVEERTELVDTMIATLLTALASTFPAVPLQNIVRRIEVVPASRLAGLDVRLDGVNSAASTPLPYPKSKSTSSLEEALPPSSSLSTTSSSSSLLLASYSGGGGTGTPTGGTAGPCGGFSTQYAWMCDLLGLPYREEVAWDVDTIYLSHDSRELCLNDFDHLEARDLVAIVSALEYNGWFVGVRASHVKLGSEAMERFLHVVRKSLTIEELHLENIGAKADFAQKLSAALSYNTNSQVHTIDLSHNMIEDKGAIHLSGPLSKLCRGPVWLNLSQCGLSAKGVAQLAHALALNRCAPNSLTHLNLAGNSLKDDINNLCNFLAQPNCIRYLDLSGTDCAVETVFGALLRGCTTHLAHLALARNNFATKKGREMPPSFKQFLTSSLALKHLSLAQSKLSLEALKQLLLGLACNENTADVELDISGNGLGSHGAHVLESCLHGITCLATLDLSDNNLEGDLAGVITAAGKNKSLKHLNIGRNLHSTKSKHVAQVMDAIVQVLQEEDCVLQTLSLADSKLKGELYSVINALGSNQTLQNIDISGNQMGDVGARLLAKALQINSRLRSITYDRNNITLQGFSDIAYGLESNMSVRYMAFPVHDALPCMKVSGEKTEAVMKRIQDLIYRNSQPKKTPNNGGQAFRLQQGFLLSSAQQTVDKLISQTQDGVKLLRKNELNSPSNDSQHSEVINQAENLIQDSERAKQLLANLHELIQQKGESNKVIETKLQSLAEDLHSTLNTHIQSNIERVLELTSEKCGSLVGEEAVKAEIKQGCADKSAVSADFVRHCVMDIAGADIINKLNEVHLAVAAHISDKLVDRAIDSLMKCHKQLNDVSKKRSSTPDVLKNRLRSSPSDLSCSKDMVGDTSSPTVALSEGNLTLSDQSPMATPQLQAKRKGLHGRRIRPKSVVDCVEGISADDIPDLLPSLPKTIEETGSALVDLPPVSPQQLKHLGKARPKKPKTRAPSRPSVRPPTGDHSHSHSLMEDSISELEEGIEGFFLRPGSATPTLMTPDSDDPPSTTTSHALDSTSSILSTPTHSSRTFKADEAGAPDAGELSTSPGSFDSSSSLADAASLSVRSKSTDCIEKPDNVTAAVSPASSPVQKIGVSTVGSNVLKEIKARQEKRTSAVFITGAAATTKIESVSASPPKIVIGKAESASASSVSSCVVTEGNKTTVAVNAAVSKESVVSVSEAKERFANKNSIVANATAALNNVNKRPPPVAPKPRPWSVVGSDRRSGEFSLGSDGSSPLGSNAVTPDTADVLDEGGKASVSEPMSLPHVKDTKVGLLSSSPSASNNQPSSLLHLNFANNNGTVGEVTSSSDVVPKEEILNSSSGHGVKSLPAWAAVTDENKPRSVRELAASLARHQSTQEAPPEPIKKKSDSLPRNSVPPPSTNNSTVENQDFERARVCIQEWTKHHSIGEVWKVPLRKFSADKPIGAKRWEASSAVGEGKTSPSTTENPFGLGRLRKVSHEDDVVNV